MNSKVSYAVAAILGGASFGARAAEPATGSTEAGTEELAQTQTLTPQEKQPNAS